MPMKSAHGAWLGFGANGSFLRHFKPKGWHEWVGLHFSGRLRGISDIR
jgi:hypothetical protein